MVLAVFACGVGDIGAHAGTLRLHLDQQLVIGFIQPFLIGTSGSLFFHL